MLVIRFNSLDILFNSGRGLKSLKFELALDS